MFNFNFYGSKLNYDGIEFRHIHEGKGQVPVQPGLVQIQCNINNVNFIHVSQNDPAFKYLPIFQGIENLVIQQQKLGNQTIQYTNILLILCKINFKHEMLDLFEVNVLYSRLVKKNLPYTLFSPTRFRILILLVIWDPDHRSPNIENSRKCILKICEII